MVFIFKAIKELSPPYFDFIKYNNEIHNTPSKGYFHIKINRLLTNFVIGNVFLIVCYWLTCCAYFWLYLLGLPI